MRLIVRVLLQFYKLWYIFPALLDSYNVKSINHIVDLLIKK